MGRGRKPGPATKRLGCLVLEETYDIIDSYLYVKDENGRDIPIVEENGHYLTRTDLVNDALKEYIDKHFDVEKTVVKDSEGNSEFKYIVTKKENVKGPQSYVAEAVEESTMPNLSTEELIAKAQELGIDLDNLL